MTAQVDRSADGVRDPSTLGQRGASSVGILYVTDAGIVPVDMPTRVYISFSLSFIDGGVTYDQIWIEAAYSTSFTPDGAYGPQILYIYEPNLTHWGSIGDPGAFGWPSPTYILDNEFPAYAVVEGQPTGDWSVCFDRDMTSFVSGISDGVVVPDLTRNLVISFDNAAGPGHRRDWVEESDGESLSFDTIFGTTLGYRIEPFGFCLFDNTPPGGDPYEPLTPPLEWDDWPEPLTTPPLLPDTPFVPPEDGGEWDIEHETPKEDLPQEEFEDHFESAIVRWKARLGIPSATTFLGAGTANVPQRYDWAFTAYGQTWNVALDFAPWASEIALFRLLLNASVVVWVCMWIYDAIRSF